MNNSSYLKIMKIAFFASYLLMLMACNPDPFTLNLVESETRAVPNEELVKHTIASDPDQPLYSFAFVGCNRLEREDVSWNKEHNNLDPSSANTAALKKIFDDVNQRELAPNAFFMLGDLVTGEKSTAVLDYQLSAWNALYNNTDFSRISKSDIEFIASPGNHEMLTYADHREFPLAGATDTWSKHMKSMAPSDRTIAGSGEDQLSFSFIRKNIGFIVMNTDTYNAKGIEGETPTQWIINAITEFEANQDIEHIFVLGHKPHYALNNEGGASIQEGHAGFNDGNKVWTAMQASKKSIAMLSAHLHDYQRMQPAQDGPHQVIAGHAGSKGEAPFFGYSKINVYPSGRIELKTFGYDAPQPYNAQTSAPMTERDSANLRRS